MDPFPFSSTSDLAAAIRARTISSVAVLDHFRDRIERLNPALNAVIVTDFERATAAARAADDTVALNVDVGPLHGVPLTVKEALSVRGLPTTAGARIYRDNVPDFDAAAVARLRAAGAIIFGKSNVSTFCGDWQSSNPLYGTTNNPWDLTRTAGGSSGGAAAAVAAGLTTFELGSDLGGSIRIPAHYCGVYGHKPTFGLVPMLGHVPGPPGTRGEPDLSVIGPLARSAEDLRLALEIIAGPTGPAATATRVTLLPPRATQVRDLRIRVWLEDDACPIDGVVRDVLAQLIPLLQKAGARVDVGPPPGLSLARFQNLFEPLLAAELGAGLSGTAYERMLRAPAGQRLPPEQNPFPERTAAYLDGMVTTHRQWLALKERRARLAGAMAEFFRETDLLITPVVPTTAFPHDLETPFFARTLSVNGAARHYLDHLPWIGIATATGLPATAAPVGIGADGLPVGAQLIGPAYGDLTTLAAAAALAEITGGFQAPPGYG